MARALSPGSIGPRFLALLRASPDGILHATQVDLAAKLGVTRQHLGRRLGLLLRAGLLHREAQMAGPRGTRVWCWAYSLRPFPPLFLRVYPVLQPGPKPPHGDQSHDGAPPEGSSSEPPEIGSSEPAGPFRSHHRGYSGFGQLARALFDALPRLRPRSLWCWISAARRRALPDDAIRWCLGRLLSAAQRVRHAWAYLVALAERHYGISWRWSAARPRGSGPASLASCLAAMGLAVRESPLLERGT